MDKTIVFLDARVQDREVLISQFDSGTVCVVLDAHRDGLQQILDALAGQSGFGSVQIFSHGSSGAITVGSTVLDLGNIAIYQSALNSIGQAITENGDLLLYGCNVGAGEQGGQFI